MGALPARRRRRGRGGVGRGLSAGSCRRRAGRRPRPARTALDLLRWFRFLWAVEVGWDRATRVEARDFCRWLQIAGKPRARIGAAGTSRDGAECSTGGGLRGRPYAASVRAHSETVLRSFYDFHLDAGTGPILNPFPLDRSRRGRRAHAHRNPMDPHATSEPGCTGRRCRPGCRAASRTRSSTRSSRGCRSHRDRALVAFYVSTGARASELLSATQGGVDPGRGLITVVRKGSREIAAAAGVAGRVRLAAALPGRDGRADPARAQPARCGGRCGARPGR